MATSALYYCLVSSCSRSSVRAFTIHNSHRIRSSSIARSFSRLRSTTDTSNDAAAAAATTSTAAADDAEILGIEWVRSVVRDVLNDEFDPREIARQSALAKLAPKKKKKKKKKTDDDATAAAQAAPPPLTEEEKAEVGRRAYDAAPSSFSVADGAVTPATRPEFGDYQCNAAMALGDGRSTPRERAQRIVDALVARVPPDVLEPPEIAGPGFVNLRHTDGHLSRTVVAMARDVDGRLAAPRAARTERIVVDFSSPNVAKEMHVGHLRSTVIGDALSNMLEFRGHDVLRLNHVGDWGTQFGMLVEHLRDECPAALLPNETVDLGDLVALYRAAKKRFDDDDDFKTRARDGVVRLQSGDPESLKAWENLCDASRTEYQKIYDRLGVTGLEERGESFYNPYLGEVVEDLEKQGLAVQSEGATAVFLDGYTNRDGSSLPMLVRKSDGGFNYATTDLAAVRHRVNEERADRVLYVTDAGQSQHFEMVFAAARRAGLCPPTTSLEHVPFGLVQGADGRKFATRSGDTVRLRDLLDEAVEIAGRDVRDRADSVLETEKEIRDVVDAVAIGAVRYADLSLNRESNYRFDSERMLSLNGNTAPYMLYAYARVRGIVRRTTGVEDDGAWPEPADELVFAHETERSLARSLIRLPDVLAEVEADLYPNRVCDYLFETSQKFNQFYENCPVGRAETSELRASRLTLCTVTAATIRLLMNLLGIRVVDRL